MDRGGRSMDRGGRGFGVGTGIGIGIGTGIIQDAIQRSRQRDEVSTDDDRPSRKKSRKGERTTKRGKDGNDQARKGGDVGKGGKKSDQAQKTDGGGTKEDGKKDGDGKRDGGGKKDDSGRGTGDGNQAGKTPDDAGEGGGKGKGDGGKGAGGKDGGKTVDSAVKCCSCVERLELVQQFRSNKQKLPFHVDDPEEEDSKKVKYLKPIPSHRFQVSVYLKMFKSKEQGNLTLKWFEKMEPVPYLNKLAGAKDNEWTDMQALMENSTVQITKKDKKPPGPKDKPSDITTIGELAHSDGATPGFWPRQYLKKVANECKANSYSEAKIGTDPVYIQDQPSSYKRRKLEFRIVVESAETCECPIRTLELYATQLLVIDQNPKTKQATEEAEAGFVSVYAKDSGMYGPDGPLKDGQKISGEPPPAKQPSLPAGY